MTPKMYASKLPVPVWTPSSGLDVVIPFSTGYLARAALTAAERLSAGLHPAIRMVRVQVVPFPLELDAAPVSAAVLRQQLAPLADEFGACLQICFARHSRDGLLHVLSKESVIFIAAHRRFLWKSREERLAVWLRKQGYSVMLESVERNNA